MMSRIDESLVKKAELFFLDGASQSSEMATKVGFLERQGLNKEEIAQALARLNMGDEAKKYVSDVDPSSLTYSTPNPVPFSPPPAPSAPPPQTASGYLGWATLAMGSGAVADFLMRMWADKRQKRILELRHRAEISALESRHQAELDGMARAHSDTLARLRRTHRGDLTSMFSAAASQRRDLNRALNTLRKAVDLLNRLQAEREGRLEEEEKVEDPFESEEVQSRKDLPEALQEFIKDNERLNNNGWGYVGDSGITEEYSPQTNGPSTTLNDYVRRRLESAGVGLGDSDLESPFSTPTLNGHSYSGYNSESDDVTMDPQDRIRSAFEMILTNKDYSKTLKVLRGFLQNILTHSDPIYREIKTGREAYKQHIQFVRGALPFLESVGFQQVEGAIVFEPDNSNPPDMSNVKLGYDLLVAV
eukprot:681563_1